MSDTIPDQNVTGTAEDIRSNLGGDGATNHLNELSVGIIICVCVALAICMLLCIYIRVLHVRRRMETRKRARESALREELTRTNEEPGDPIHLADRTAKPGDTDGPEIIYPISLADLIAKLQDADPQFAAPIPSPAIGTRATGGSLDGNSRVKEEELPVSSEDARSLWQCHIHWEDPSQTDITKPGPAVLAG